jgi:nicotinate-nucleotide adenylyltransferase
MSQSTITALFGGTFDPIHRGHLQVATALATEVGLDSIHLLPNNIPPHKPQPQATTLQRLEMLTLATQSLALFKIDTRELTRTTSSYTIDTLIEWRAEQNQTNTLVFIIGEDALYTLNKWHRWQEILNYCHLLICRRSLTSNIHCPESVKFWLQQHITENIAYIRSKPSGYIYLSNTPITDCSSTEIRSKLAKGKNCATLVPESVWHYIQQNKLYR